MAVSFFYLRILAQVSVPSKEYGIIGVLLS